MSTDFALDGLALRSVKIDRVARSNFFVAYSTLLLSLLFLGFAPSFFLRSMFDTEPLSPAAWAHGIVLTGWFLVFVGQSLLVRTGRTDLHRKIGRAGVAIAAAGTVGFIWLAFALYSGRPPNVDPELVERAKLFRIVRELTVFAAFPVLVTLAILLRRKPDIHKRLMLLATVAILPPGINRLLLWSGDIWPAIRAVPHFALLFGILAMLLVVAIVRDRIYLGRIHPAFGWGAPIWFIWLVGSGLVVPKLLF